MLAISDLFEMKFRWISSTLIAAILAAEGYLLFNSYFYGPLNVVDWSGRVMTLEEKEQLLEAMRERVKGDTDAASNMEFASIVRSTLDPLTVCGMARLRNSTGVWGSWVIFDIGYPGNHPLLKQTIRRPFLQGIGEPLDEQRIVYQVHDVVREITPRDRFKCEPTTCEKCDSYSWEPIAEID
jgi:hypothetical protein